MKEDSDHTNLGIGAVERSEADVTRQLNHRLSERVQVEGAVLAVTCTQLTRHIQREKQKCESTNGSTQKPTQQHYTHIPVCKR